MIASRSATTASSSVTHRGGGHRVSLQIRRAAAAADLDAGGLGDQLDDVGHLDADIVAGGRQRPLRPDAGTDEHVDAEFLAARASAGVADRLGDLGLLDGQSAAAAGAVRPLRDVVDVLERQARESSSG